MLIWVSHELMASILFLLLLLSLQYISCFKSKRSPRGRLYFSSFVSSLSLSEWEGGSNSHKGDRDRGESCWQSTNAEKESAVLPDHRHKNHAPTSLHCPASSAKQIACPAARDSSLVTWLFSPFHQPRSSEGFTRGERLHKVMETRQGNREAIASSQLQRRGGCNEAWSVTRKNHRPVFAFSSPFFILLPYLSFLLLIKREKKRQWGGRWGVGGGDMHTEESREGKESTFLLGRQKMIKG